MNDLDDLPPTADPEFDTDPVRWDQHRHTRRVRAAVILALLLAALTSLSMCMVTDQAAHHHQSGAAATERVPHERTESVSGAGSGS